MLGQGKGRLFFRGWGMGKRSGGWTAVSAVLLVVFLAIVWIAVWAFPAAAGPATVQAQSLSGDQPASLETFRALQADLPPVSANDLDVDKEPGAGPSGEQASDGQPPEEQLTGEQPSGEGRLSYIQGGPLSEQQKQAVRNAVSAFAGKGGYLPEEEGPEELDVLGAGVPQTMLLKDLPAQYDQRREGGLKTSVRTQKYGDCWAIAALDLLEMNVRKQGILTEELSPRHLVYYAFHSVTGTPGQQPGEGTDYLDDGNARLCFWNGGRFEYAIRTLESHVGAALEADFPYEAASEALPKEGESAYHTAALRLRNAYVIPARNLQTVKEAVLEYGAVGITYCSSLSYYQYDTAAQYCPNDEPEDHAVVIVGWDDGYSRGNFAQAPARDGAWLVKNNWGTVFGDQGYFWLSYEDASIASRAYVLEAGPVERYDTIYQCDNTLLDGIQDGEGELILSNRYELSADWGMQERIRAVRVAVPTAGMEYELQLYLGSGEGDPESGEALLDEPLCGFLPHTGTYTIDLPEGIVADYGDTVNIVLRLTGASVAISTDVTRQSLRTVCKSVGGTAASFWKRDGSWEDYGNETGQNFRIKLLTSQGDRMPLTEEAIAAVYQEYLAAQEEETGSGVPLLYRRLLGREGEPQGVRDWQGRQEEGELPIRILYGFLYSEEWASKHPQLIPSRETFLFACLEGAGTADGTVREGIAGLYRKVLGREYDLPGLLDWCVRFGEGLSLEEMERLFYQSEEYQTLVFSGSI